MSLIESIKAKFATDRFELTKHAVDRSIIRGISIRELREAVSLAEVIEDYPDDKYGPSCLIYGQTKAGRPIHVHVSYPYRSVVKVITMYEPDPNLWHNFKERK